MSAGCARSGGAVLCALYRLRSPHWDAVRVSLQVAQLELNLIADKVLPGRAHFIARMQMQRFSTAPERRTRR